MYKDRCAQMVLEGKEKKAETGEDKQKAALDLYRCCFWNLNFARERQE